MIKKRKGWGTDFGGWGISRQLFVLFEVPVVPRKSILSKAGNMRLACTCERHQYSGG